MHAAQVLEYGQAPRYVEVPDPPSPNAAHGELRLKVLAAGVHNVVRTMASGKHYSSGALPVNVGIDGVGETADGTKVYFLSFLTGGALADYINVPQRNMVPLPEGLDPIQAAGALNPATSSWMAMNERTAGLPKAFTVLILGVTSASGALAVPLARAMGAKRVIGAARGPKDAASLGVDQYIAIDAEDATKTDFSSLGDVDLVLDYIFGPLTVHLFKSIKSSRPVQYVHIGGLSALEISLPGSVLRSKDITIRGSGPGSFDQGTAMRKHVPGLLKALINAPKPRIVSRPLKDIEQTWDVREEGRLVYVP